MEAGNRISVGHRNRCRVSLVARNSLLRFVQPPKEWHAIAVVEGGRGDNDVLGTEATRMVERRGFSGGGERGFRLGRSLQQGGRVGA